MKKITSLFVMAMVAMTMSAQGTRTIYLDAGDMISDSLTH